MNKVEKIVEFILSWKFIGPIVYIILGFIIYSLIVKIINNIKIRRKGKNHKKEDTVINLIKNIFKYLIIIIVILMSLELYGINTSSILTSLGIVGVVMIFIYFVIEMTSMESFGIPYTTPFSPTFIEGIKNSFFRVPVWNLKTRKSYLSDNKIKLKEKSDGDLE